MYKYNSCESFQLAFVLVWSVHYIRVTKSRSVGSVSVLHRATSRLARSSSMRIRRGLWTSSRFSPFFSLPRHTGMPSSWLVACFHLLVNVNSRALVPDDPRLFAPTSASNNGLASSTCISRTRQSWPLIYSYLSLQFRLTSSLVPQPTATAMSAKRG